MFKDRSIEGKFIVSIVLISLITLIFGYFTLSWYVQQNKVKAYGQIQKNITTKINHQFNTKKLIGLTNAVSIVNDIRIKEALKTDNRELAITSLRDLEKKIKDISPYKNIKIHLHTKDIKSFVRFWRLDKFGDDLSGFRDSLVKVKKTRKELTTFDIGKAGLTYRSIIPILDKDDNYLGSLEIIQGLTSIAKQLDKVDSGFVLLMDKKKVEVSQFNEDKLFQKNYLISQNFVNDIFIKDAQNIDLKSIFKDKYFLTKKFFYTHIDIKDYKNKKLGIVLVGTPTNRLNTMLSASNEIIYMALLITISLGIFIISVMGFILKRFVLNPLHLLEKGLKSFFDYLEDSKKEIHEIPITSNDEFGKMNENINK
ncbi:MAG: cache domain-containing protein, partial [Campylobacterota bacterium]|nr:cache domain-containing protein [Campylobacterota bacterium]